MITRLTAAFLLCVLFLSGRAPADVVNVPLGGDPTVVQGAMTESKNGKAYRVPAGGVLMTSGSQVVVFVEKGGSATVTGTESAIYVDGGGAAIVTGKGNRIFVTTRSAVTNIPGPENKTAFAKGFKIAGRDATAVAKLTEPDPFVPPPVAAVTPPAKATPAPVAAPPVKATPAVVAMATTPAVKASPAGTPKSAGPAGGGGAISNLLRLIPPSSPDLEGVEVVRPPREAGNNLIGSWKVASLILESPPLPGIELTAGGSFYLYPTGAGLGNLALGTADSNGKRMFRFNWRATGSEFFINENAEYASQWKRTQYKADAQEVRPTLKPGQFVSMRLERMPEAAAAK